MTCSHSCFLLRAGTRAAILRAGLVELPGKVKHEGATGWVVRGQFAIAIDDGIRVVGMEGVAATEVKGQRAKTAQVAVSGCTIVSCLSTDCHSVPVMSVSSSLQPSGLSISNSTFSYSCSYSNFITLYVVFDAAKLQIVADAAKHLGYSARFCDEWEEIM